MSRLIVILLIGPFLAYLALGIGSAIFTWASDRTTPWWHRYLGCVLLSIIAIHIGEGGH